MDIATVSLECVKIVLQLVIIILLSLIVKGLKKYLEWVDIVWGYNIENKDLPETCRR